MAACGVKSINRKYVNVFIKEYFLPTEKRPAPTKADGRSMEATETGRLWSAVERSVEAVNAARVAAAQGQAA